MCNDSYKLFIGKLAGKEPEEQMSPVSYFVSGSMAGLTASVSLINVLIIIRVRSRRIDVVVGEDTATTLLRRLSVVSGPSRKS